MATTGKSLRWLHTLVICAVLIGALAAGAAPTARAADRSVPWGSDCGEDFKHLNGAVGRICTPTLVPWNGDLVVYAHGYVDPTQPIAIPEDQLTIPQGDPNGASIPGLMNILGFAFATTSYGTNGLAIQGSIPELVDLVHEFEERVGVPSHVYLVGPSEGGQISALGAEAPADTFDGVVSTCGPVGSFCRQINYWGDVRVLFDYFFPGVLPGSPIEIPTYVMDDWDGIYEGLVRDALHANPRATAQLIKIAGVPVDPTDPESGIEALVQVLWYNVFATNDGISKLGGQPYDNKWRIYRGSDNDLQLNRTVQRFKADPAAIQEIQAYYDTTGRIQVPLVTVHTLGDPVVPYWHEPLYRLKIFKQGKSALHLNIPSLRYGHCNFTPAEVLAGFAILVYRVRHEPIAETDIVRALPDAKSLDEYHELLRQNK